MELGASLRLLRLRKILPLLFRQGSLPALTARLDGEVAPGRTEPGGVRPSAASRAEALLPLVASLTRPLRLWRTTCPWCAPAGSAAPHPEGGCRVAFAWPADPANLARRTEANVDGIKASEEAVLTELKDGTGVLLHLGSKHYYTLNATGVLLWKFLADGTASSAGGLASAIAARFPGADAAAVRGDVEALLAELAAERLVSLPG